MSFKDIFSAAKEGTVEDVRFFLAKKGVDVNAKDTNGSPLHYAAGNANIKVVKLLVSKGADVNAKGGSGATPLHWAVCNSKNAKLVDLLVSQGAHINAKDAEGMTPLHAAVVKGNVDIAKLLISAGADTKTKSKKGLTPLRIAREKGNMAMVECLSNISATHETPEQTVNPIQPDEKTKKGEKHGYEDLFDAMKNGTLHDVKVFIKEKALGIEAANQSGNNMLHCAVMAGKLDIVKYIIDLGVNVNAKNNNGGTPLSVAASSIFLAPMSTIKDKPFVEKLSIMEHLIKAKANIDEEVFLNGATILLSALRCGADHSIIDLFVKKGANVDKADDKHNHSALHTASEYIGLNNETAKLIVSKSKNIDLQDIYGNTPLHQACYAVNMEMVKLLLSFGANINKPNNKGITPLHAAISKPQIEIMRYLISKKANVNAPGEDNWTPLHWAAQEGDVEIARILVDAGADTNAKTKMGSTALMMARQFGHYDLEKYLSSRTY
jgi:ankyrin repeat protein